MNPRHRRIKRRARSRRRRLSLLYAQALAFARGLLADAIAHWGRPRDAVLDPNLGPLVVRAKGASFITPKMVEEYFGWPEGSVASLRYDECEQMLVCTRRVLIKEYATNTSFKEAVGS